MRKFVVVAMLMVSCVALAADWPQFLGPDRDGISPEKDLSRNWPAKGPAELWKVDTQKGYGSAAVQGGKAYYMDRDGDKKDVVVCVDIKKGTKDWTFEYGAPGSLSYPGARSTPLVDDKFVYAVGPFGDFNCIDKETQKSVWKKQLIKDFDGTLPRWGVSQSPASYKDWVIVAPQSKTVGVIACDRKTGDVKWQSKPLGSMTYCSPMVVTLEKTDQIIMVSTGKDKTAVNGLDPATGEILWTYTGYSCANPIPSPTHCGEGQFFLTGGYNAGSQMIKVEKKDGKWTASKVWESKELASQMANAIFWKDHLYINSDNTGAGLCCVTLDGKVKWKTANAPGFEHGEMIIADRLIYILDGNSGKLRLVEANPEAYKELGVCQPLSGKEVWAPITLSDGKLIIRDSKQMKCLDVSPAGAAAGTGENATTAPTEAPKKKRGPTG